MFEKEVTDLCCATCNAEVSCKEKCECWTFAKKSVEFGYNKANERLTKAKELIGELISSLSVVGECEEEECELLNRAEEFISEVEK